MNINTFYKSFKTIGNELFQAGLNNFHSGNLSIRDKNNVLITATGSKLGFLDPEDLVCIDLLSEDIKNASCEAIVHKAIYSKTKENAIVHAHAPYSVVLSFISDVFYPMDGEGKFYFPNGVPVLKVKNSVASEEVAQKIPELLLKNKAVIVQGHGIFAVGNDLIEGAKWVSSIENSAKLVYLYKGLKGEVV